MIYSYCVVGFFSFVNLFCFKDFLGTTEPRIFKFGTIESLGMSSCIVYLKINNIRLKIDLFIHFSFYPINFLRNYFSIPRSLKLGTNLGYHKLYCVFDNQLSPAYQSLYLYCYGGQFRRMGNLLE